MQMSTPSISWIRNMVILKVASLDQDWTLAVFAAATNGAKHSQCHINYLLYQAQFTTTASTTRASTPPMPITTPAPVRQPAKKPQSHRMVGLLDGLIKRMRKVVDMHHRQQAYPEIEDYGNLDGDYLELTRPAKAKARARARILRGLTLCPQLYDDE
ncbi:unnamed protein product [Notodromas monacha]|uniref:Uncharacterized protein n=1 Tax=Notodromas monacha TaxID=399045 RepID=A0A7R9BJA3_9CRUS|nr:unnamed protein product [Notodromas monacha]CAG0914999.1 unnamed protein product [Notodromas monacha]